MASLCRRTKEPDVKIPLTVMSFYNPVYSLWFFGSGYKYKGPVLLGFFRFFRNKVIFFDMPQGAGYIYSSVKSSTPQINIPF